VSPLLVAVLVIVGVFCAASVVRALRMKLEELRGRRSSRRSSRT